MGWEPRAQASFKQMTLLGQSKLANFVEKIRQACHYFACLVVFVSRRRPCIHPGRAVILLKREVVTPRGLCFREFVHHRSLCQVFFVAHYRLSSVHNVFLQCSCRLPRWTLVLDVVGLSSVHNVFLQCSCRPPRWTLVLDCHLCTMYFCNAVAGYRDGLWRYQNCSRYAFPVDNVQTVTIDFVSDAVVCCGHMVLCMCVAGLRAKGLKWAAEMSSMGAKIGRAGPL